MSRAVPSPGHQLTTLRANIAETLSPAVITEQGENGYQLEYLTGRHQAPWPTDAQVEQDLVLSRALTEIFKHPLLSLLQRTTAEGQRPFWLRRLPLSPDVL